VLGPSQALVAHPCNPSYLGGWDREDWGLSPEWAKNLQDPASTDSWVQCYMPVILSYLGSWDWENHGSKPTWGDQGGICETPSQWKKSWVWRCAPVSPATERSINRRTVVHAGPGKKQDHVSKITRAKKLGVWFKQWRALQAWSPAFKTPAPPPPKRCLIVQWN
jgi:hypothetical protein